MRRSYPAMWRTSDQYVRAINGRTLNLVFDTLAECIVMHDPFQCPDLHGHTRNLNPSFVATALRVNGF